jgi:murein DD-endopeptidase MepM/ murein hydrolase activator NlpD
VPGPAPSPRRALRSATVVAAVTAMLIGVAALPALAITPAPAPLPQTPRVDITRQVVDLTFPVANPGSGVSFIDDFLYLRGGGSRLHAATDVMAPKHRPIHATVGGTILFAPTTEPSYGWMLSIRGDDGRRYAYVHLNNDTPVKAADGKWLDDDAGEIAYAYGPRIVQSILATGGARGLRVERGELIGYVGDSGNAKGGAAHLHLEIHEADAEGEYRINPFDSLKAALQRGDVPSSTTTQLLGAFRDVDPAGAHAGAIGRLALAGIVRGCGPELYCPSTAVTRGDLASYVAAALGLDTSGTPRFSDVSPGDRNAGAIAAVDSAKILQGYGDGRFGPNDPLSRAQLASMLVRGFKLPAVSGSAPFSDVSATSVHGPNIAAAYATGLTRGCGDGTRYCGTQSVTRAQIASFIEGGLKTR